MDGEESQSYSFAEFTLDPRRRRLLRVESQVPLNAKAFDLLYFLARNAGRVITKDEILNSVWKDQFVEEANLTVQVSSIRKALGDQSADPRFLVTIPGKGYQFVADVLPMGDRDRPPDVETETIELIDEPAAENSKFASNHVAAISVIAVVLTLVAGFAAFKYFAPVDELPFGSVAVLPFEDETEGGSSETYLADGLAEGVIFSLSRIPDLRVMSRDSVFTFRGEQADVQRIGQELGVQTVLRGRFLRSGDSISVSTELVSTKDKSVIWGERFTTKMTGLERMQGEIAKSVVRGLKIKLTGTDASMLSKHQTDNYEAYQLYLVGRHHLNRSTDDGFAKGRDSFRQAIEKDSNYALAYAGLADAYGLLASWGSMAPNEGYPLAKSAAIRALELDETLAEAHTSLAAAKLFYDADWVGAEESVGRAIEINSNHSDAHMIYGYTLMLQGRFADAKPYLKRSIELDPLSIVKKVSLGNAFYFERDSATAIDLYEQALNIDPNSGLARWSLGNAFFQAGRTDDATAEYEKAIPLSGDSPDEVASLAFAYAVTGRMEDARRLIGDLEKRAGRAYTPPALLAAIYGALGERDTAFEHLEQAFRQRDSMLVYLKVDPLFDPLRNDPRFADLLARIGLNPQEPETKRP